MQTERGLRSTATGITKDLLLKELARVKRGGKWFLWHGNVVRADDTLSSLIDEVDGVREEDREAGRPPQLVFKKLLAHWTNSAPTSTITPERSLTTGSCADVASASRLGLRIDDQSAHREALREETADAMDASRRTLTTAGARARPQ